MNDSKPKASGSQYRKINQINASILYFLVVCDDGLEMVFERSNSTDKQDSVASQESNETIIL